MQEMGARDRLIMVGLVVLGLMTVVAGVLSGRTTLQYVLDTDAREAVASWTAAVEQSLAKDGSLPSDLFGHSVRVIDQAGLKAHDAPGSETFDQDGSHDDGRSTSLGLESFLLNWVRSQRSIKTEEDSGDFVSKLAGFALLTPERQVLASSGKLTSQSLSALLREEQIRTSLNRALISGRPVLEESVGAPTGETMAFVPVLTNGKIERVYAFEVDQKAAASMTDVALTVVSLATSLLIVMGFSIPAAIASRRIRERWKAEEKIRFLALHDSLTGLPNRLQLRQTLDRAVGRCKRQQNYMAVLCLDLDRFKDINDTLGHPTGDALLQEVSARLTANVREVDLVGRLGGDEFAIVAEHLDSPEDILPLARRVCQALSETYKIDGHEVVSSGSIGIAIGPDDGQNGDELLKNADLALYRAKQDGRNTYRFFEPSMDAALQKRRRLEHDLRLAVRNEELRVEYQPQFDLKTGVLNGYEALARWTHPQDGEISPSVFLPLAEETGLIAPLGEWVLRTACRYAVTWDDQTRLAVNLSPVQFKVQDVVGMVRRVLDETGLDPHRLELEITESLLLQNTDSVVGMLEALDRLGVSIAMDDFGTGYSSLSYLTRFPVRKIKIDRSFIDTLGENNEASAIVSSIVGLGKSLHVTITAEGVENAAQADILRRWGCNQVQGFYYGPPESSVAPDEHAKEQDQPLVA